MMLTRQSWRGRFLLKRMTPRKTNMKKKKIRLSNTVRSPTGSTKGATSAEPGLATSISESTPQSAKNSLPELTVVGLPCEAHDWCACFGCRKALLASKLTSGAVCSFLLTPQRQFFR
jgi:hypothetical protein